MIPSEFQPPGCSIPLAEIVKRVVNIPVIVSGKLGYPQVAETVLQDGKADFIALGRPLLADPDWPNKVREGKVEDIRPCIGCFEGCRRRIHEGKALSCAVNPAAGQEKELAISSAEKKKSVVVIGGGPGGMEAARVCALKGHRVTLFEKGEELGGNLLTASVPVFKQDYRMLIHYLSTQIKKVGVDIILQKEVTAELIEKLNPHVVFVATGSTQIVPDIPGVRNGRVVNVLDILSGRMECGKSVTLIGGGTVACEFALHVAQKGAQVTIVEILAAVARNMYSINRMHLIQLLQDAHVKILTNHQVLEITDAGVVIADSSNTKSLLTADTIVLALGANPNTDLLKTLMDKVPEVYPIGDCMAPRNVMHAMWEAFRTARIT
jgi:2-enoate reductase